MATIRILHVSDVHFGCDVLGEQNTITNDLIQDAHAHARKTAKPDLCIFSGDLAQRGTRGELDDGAKWLAKLVAPWNCPVFIVPGNHEVQRPEKNSEAHRRSLALRHAVAVSERSYHQQLASLEKVDLLDEFFRWHRAARRFVPGLVSNWQESRLACRYTGKLGGVTTHVVGLNTAIASSDDDDRGMLVADVGILNKLLDGTDADRELIIAVTHHPITFPGTRAQRWLAKWNNDALANRLYQKRGAHLYLHGHVHASSAGSTSNSWGQQLVVFGAGAAYQGSRYPQRFAFYQIDFDKPEVTPATFRYEGRSGEWILANDESWPTSGLPTFPKPAAAHIPSAGTATSPLNAPTPSMADPSGVSLDLPLLARAYDHSVRSTARVIDNLYPIRPGKDQVLRHHLARVASATVIAANGDGKVTNTLTIAAGSQRVHFWRTGIKVEEDSPAVAYLVGAQVEIRDITPRSKSAVVFLPTRDEGHQKEIVVFFLPAIPSHGARTIELRYRWPGYVKRLVDGNTVEFAWGYPTGFATKTTKLDLSVEFHRKLGRVRCDNKTLGDRAGTLTEERVAGGTRWVYRHPRALLAKGAVVLTFDRTTS